MANLAYRRESVARLLGSVLAPGASYTVTAYPAGAQVSGNQSGTTITVRAGHYIPYGGTDVVAIRPGSPATIVSGTFQAASSATATTVVFPSSVTVVDGDLIVPLGSDTGTSTPLWDGSAALIYTDMNSGSAISSSRVTCNTSGEYEYWSLRRAVWEIVRDSSGTLQDIVPSVFPNQRQYGRFVVTDFGAVPGSGTDSLNGVQAAINAAYDNGGGDVVFPVGGFYVSNTITMYSGVRLVGEGKWDSTGTAPTVGAFLSARSGFAGTNLITNDGTNGLNDLEVRNLYVTGNGLATYGIKWAEAHNCDIHYTTVANCTKAGIWLQRTSSATNCRLAHVVTYSNCTASSLADYEGSCTIEWTDCRVTDCNFSTSSTDYAESGKRVGLLLRGGGSHFIANTFCDISETGVVFDNSGTNILVNVRADRCRGDGFVFTDESSTSNNSLVNCYALSCGAQTTGTYDGFDVASTRNNCLIGCKVSTSGNTVANAYVSGDSGSGVNWFIGCHADTSAYATNLYSLTSKTRVRIVGQDSGNELSAHTQIFSIGRDTDETITLRFNRLSSAKDFAWNNTTGQFELADDLSVTGYITASTFVIGGVTTGITASTTQTQVGGTALTTEINNVATVANANDTVTLPSAAAGRRCVIFNNGANTLRIYPASGDNLGTGVDTLTTLAAGSNLYLIAYDATNWETV